MSRLFRHKRYYSLTFDLNPFTWWKKPSFYRFDHKRAAEVRGTSVPEREGDANFGPVTFNWYREAKRG